MGIFTDSRISGLENRVNKILDEFDVLHKTIRTMNEVDRLNGEAISKFRERVEAIENKLAEMEKKNASPYHSIVGSVSFSGDAPDEGFPLPWDKKLSL